MKVFSPDFKAGGNEVTAPGFVEVITNPTTSSGNLTFNEIVAIRTDIFKVFGSFGGYHL